MTDIKVTKREILFSIVIILIMIGIGFIISGKINNNLMNEYQKYNTALKIDNDSELFSYGMRTNAGNAFIYGKLQAIDTVTYEEIKGEYAYIKKITERYTQHTKTVTYTDSKGKTKTRVETYWTWDEIDRESKHCKEIKFCGNIFDYEKINFPEVYYIDTLDAGFHLRNVYYGTNTEYIGTIFTNLKDNTISNCSLYSNQKINEVVKNLESGWQLVVFWVCWILGIIIIVIIFYIIDNKWLEDKEKRCSIYD